MHHGRRWLYCQTQITILPTFIDRANSLLLQFGSAWQVVTQPYSADAKVDLRLLGLEARFDWENRNCLVTLEDALHPNLAEHVLLDALLPCILGIEGRAVIHGATLAQFDDGFVLVGRTGQGKSTLTASLMGDGFTNLGDDAAIIEVVSGSATARPIYPSLRLMEDSARALDMETEGAELVPGPRQKLRFAHSGKTRTEVLLRAIFVLDPAPDSQPNLTRLNLNEAVRAVILSSFRVNHQQSASERKSLFQNATEIVAAVPVFRLSYPHDYSLLPQIHDLIRATLDDLQLDDNRR